MVVKREVLLSRSFCGSVSRVRTCAFSFWLNGNLGLIC